MKNSYIIKNDTFSQLKSRIYIALMPVFIVAFIIVFFTLYHGDKLKTLYALSLPFLVLGLTICFILVKVNKNNTFLADLFLCLLSAILFLTNIIKIVIFDLGQNGNVHLGPVAYWTPLAYLLLSFTFRGKIAFASSTFLFVLTLLPGFYHLLYSPVANSNTFDTLIQYYIASYGYILCLFFTQNIFEGYMNAENEKQNAVTDYLTNLPNRRKMDMHLQEICSVWKSNIPITVILFDVDKFKRVNDIFGHDIGDEVLKDLAMVVKSYLPEHTYFGRWGGEEFLIFSVNKNKAEGMELAEKIRMGVAEHQFNKVGTVTCSFGVAILQENELQKDVLKRADEALYLAKDLGRNQVRFSE